MAGAGTRQNAVGAAHLAPAHMDGRGQNLLWGQVVDQPAHSHHVGHGVQGAHLVKVDFLHGTAVGVALRQGDLLVDLLRVLPHVLGNVQVGENVPDVPHPRVVVMAVAVLVMLMVMLVMLMVMVVGVGVFVVMVVMVVVMMVVVVVEVYILAFPPPPRGR